MRRGATSAMSQNRNPAPPSTTSLDDPLPVWLLRGLGFFSGASVMIVEFAGNRLLSPGFGSSLYTWTGLIGVILVALSFGDYIGGWLVDKHPKFSLLPIIFGAGGLLTAAIPGLVALWPPFDRLDLVTGPIYVSLGLFFLPGLVLATVTPVSIRLLSRASGDHNIGKSAGTVGMAAALGSFAGTLATTYFLIPHFGVRQIFIVLGSALCILAIVLVLIDPRTRRRPVATVAVAFIGLGCGAWSSNEPRQPADVIFTKDTFYHRITVTETGTGTPRATRFLKLDSTMEGAQEIATGNLVFPYQHYWQLAEVFCPSIERAAFLGAGAFGMPQQLSRRFPAAIIDAVEIDPEVIAVGRKYFRLDEYPNIRAFAADARRHVRTSEGDFDFVFGDAYNGVQYVPAHLVTREFFTEIRDRMTPSGVFVMNLIGSAQGPSSELFERVKSTIDSVFAHTALFGTAPRVPSERQNLIITASAAPLEPRISQWTARATRQHAPIQALLATRIDAAASDPAKIITDDHNPIEYIVARQLR
jgi:spermidine synthase